MNAYRNPDAWPRTIEVKGRRRPLSDQEVALLIEGLDALVKELVAKDLRGSRAKVGAALLYFLSSGKAPTEPPEVRAWRDGLLMAEKRAARGLPRPERRPLRSEARKMTTPSSPPPESAPTSDPWMAEADRRLRGG